MRHPDHFELRGRPILADSYVGEAACAGAAGLCVSISVLLDGEYRNGNEKSLAVVPPKRGRCLANRLLHKEFGSYSGSVVFRLCPCRQVVGMQWSVAFVTQSLVAAKHPEMASCPAAGLPIDWARLMGSHVRDHGI